ncbi:MAG: MarR family winged helix-turn-helix transcriptional regulator [Stenotrophomonas sp.]
MALAACGRRMPLAGRILLCKYSYMQMHKSPPADVTAFRHSLIALTRRLKDVHRSDAETWSELMVLTAIQRLGITATPTSIANELSLRSSNLAQLLRELEARGLLQRHPDPDDKRRVNLSLSKPGLAVVQQTRARRDGWLSEAMEANLSAKEQALLLQAGALMQRLAQHKSSSDS